MTDATIVARSATLLANAPENLHEHRCLLGLDGFVDSICRVVQSRDDDGRVSYFPDIPALAERIGAAAGKSTALELVTEQVKLGGNGPIMAHALACLGLGVTYVGAVAAQQGGRLHPAFAALADKATVHPVCPAARTDALEMNDGKIMLQHMEQLHNLDWQTIREGVGERQFENLLHEAELVAWCHWSSLPRMTDIWRAIQRELCPGLPAARRRLFADLADPEKRGHDDLREGLTVLAHFEQWYEVCLSLNLKESEHVAAAMGCEPPAEEDERALLRARAQSIRKALGLSRVAIHPVAYAVAANSAGAACVEGPYTPQPRISTGAGDHFNAGYCLAWMLDGDLEQCLQCGVAASGYYVRSAESPGIDQLMEFLREGVKKDKG